MFKSILSNLTRVAGGAITNKIASDKISETLNKALGKAGVDTAGTVDRSFTFQSIPKSLEEFKLLPEAALNDVYAVAALSVVALTRYEVDKEVCFSILDFLKGPDPLSPTEKSQLNDRFMDGKTYKVRALFEGATPQNNYTPSRPFTVKVSSNPYSFENENWATLYVHSGGADNPRPVRLRLKPSTGQWFLVEIQYLGDIRTPSAEDKWA